MKYQNCIDGTVLFPSRYFIATIRHCRYLHLRQGFLCSVWVNHAKRILSLTVIASTRLCKMVQRSQVS